MPDQPLGVSDFGLADSNLLIYGIFLRSRPEARLDARSSYPRQTAARTRGYQGDGADARAQIDFKCHGAKWLAVAKLDPIN